MRSIAVAAGVLALTFASGALAQHGPGHQTPHGAVNAHSTPAAQLIAAAAPNGNQWRPFVDGQNGFAVELPFGMFDTVEESPRGISLRAARYGAAVDVYTSSDPKGFDPAQFKSTLEHADRVREVTYRAGGKNWFVLSGFYSRTEAGDAVIFYTKFMFSPDRSRLAAFEISFPAKQKPRFADMVERIEDSFSGPRP